MRCLVLSFRFLLVPVLLLLQTATVTAVNRPPNFIVILTDDLGYGDLGVYGNPKIKTPRLDRMAAEGVQLTEFYSPAPTCSPARISLLTGRYPKRSGLVRVLIPHEKWGIPASEITLAEALKPLGYRTALIGKWHLGGRKPYRPQRHGFDEFYGVLYSNDMSILPLVHYPRFELIDGYRAVESPAVQKNLTKNYTRRAVSFIEENRDRPFFLYLSHTMPHRPLAPSDEFRGTSAFGLYGDVVAELDWSTGQILDALQRAGIEQRTLVIFTSDNGPWVRGSYKKGIRGGSVGPLRGSKGTTWEGGMRVPMIARWPGKLPAGVVRGGIITLMDLFPTFIELAGGKVPEDRVIDGRNIFTYLQGKEKAPHSVFYYYFRTHLFAVRSGDWKLHLYKRAAPTARKLGKPIPCHPPELYNLAEDMGERVNVAEKHPDVVRRLTALGRKFDASIHPVMELPPPSTSVYQGVVSGAPKDPNKVPHARKHKQY